MLLVLGLLIRQTNPVLAIVSGALFGVLIAVGYAGMDLTTAFNSMWSGYKADFANPMLAKLLNRGGITSMLDIAALVYPHPLPGPRPDSVGSGQPDGDRQWRRGSRRSAFATVRR